MAAEIRHVPSRGTTIRTRFNEAAANGRGNLELARRGLARRARFNEAAANGRGNLPHQEPARPPPVGFNEAAANGRGNTVISLSRRRAQRWLQ